MQSEKRVNKRLEYELTREDKSNVRHALIHYFLEVDSNGLGKILNV